MKRVVTIPGNYGNTDKYVLREEYCGFGIYQQKTPSGYFVSQDYLITNDDVTVICPSYNNMCKEELYDCIDSYNEVGVFDLLVLKRKYGYIVHPSGTQV